MAKKRSVRPSSRGKRDTRRYHSPQRFDPINNPSYDPDRYVFSLRPSPALQWEITQDRRYYTPHPQNRSRRLSGARTRVIPSGKPPANDLYNSITAAIGFEAPKGVITCVRRKARREVIFATGKSGGGPRKSRSRRNFESNVRC